MDIRKNDIIINPGDIINIVMHPDGTIDIAPAKPKSSQPLPTKPALSTQPLSSQGNEPAMNLMSLGELTNHAHLGAALTSGDDWGSIEVWIADKDGEIYKLQHVVYDEEKHRLYLVRAWHGDDGENDVTFDTDLKAKVRVLDTVKTNSPTSLKDTHDSAKEWDEEDEAPSNADTSDADW